MSNRNLRGVGWSLVVIVGMASWAAAQGVKLPREARPDPADDRTSGKVGFTTNDRLERFGPPSDDLTMPVEVEIAVVKRGIFPEYNAAAGRVEADAVVPIQARVGGSVEKLEVEEGDAVKKGQLLVTIATPELGAAHESAAARLELAGHEIRRAEAALKVARLRLQHAQAAGGAAERTAAAAVELAEADLQAATARQALARAEIRQVELDEAALRLAAPCDGVVTARHVVVGQLVTPAGPPLLVVSKVDTVRIRASFPFNVGIGLHAGDPVRLVDPRAHTSDARIGRVGVAVAPQTQTVPVEVIVKNKDNSWRLGRDVRVELMPSPTPPCLLVTRWAIWDGVEGDFCIRVVDGRTKWAAVKLGRTSVDLFGLCEVLEGLNEADQLVTKEQQGITMERRYPIHLPEGRPVKISAKYEDESVSAR